MMSAVPVSAMGVGAKHCTAGNVAVNVMAVSITAAVSAISLPIVIVAIGQLTVLYLALRINIVAAGSPMVSMRQRWHSQNSG